MAAFENDDTKRPESHDDEMSAMNALEQIADEAEEEIDIDPTVKPVRKKIANVKNPTIEAIAYELLRLPTEEQALERLNLLKDYFVISKKQLENLDKPTVLMWVRGYGVSEEEEKKGYVGHYMAISIKELRGGKFTLSPTKILFDLKEHPQRQTIITGKHPNFGHPVLRSVKNKRKFTTMQRAHNHLMRLHNDYPEVSIPGVNKLFIMIYSKEKPESSPIQKYKLEVKPAVDGGFYIDCSLNEGRKPKEKNEKRPYDQQVGVTPPAEEMGAGTRILKGGVIVDPKANSEQGVFSTVEIMRKEEKMRKQASRMRIREKYQELKKIAEQKDKETE